MKDLTPTPEQGDVIDHGRSGRSFVVDAVAGSGKTTVLNMTAREMKNHRILYVVYNTAASDDAKKVFPSNVEVRTTSSLAYGSYYNDYGHRMVNASRISNSQIAKVIGLTQPLELGGGMMPLRPVTLAGLAVETVNNFAHTPALVIKQRHVPALPLGLNEVQEEMLRETVVTWARTLWTRMLTPTANLPFTFDHAFKLYAMAEPMLPYDTIMLDEAQDSNEIVEHFMKTPENMQRIVVGDPAQAMYQWRGAVDIMNRFEGPRLPLSQSWRFGNSIAHEANKWLAHTGTGLHVRGNPKLDSRVTRDGMKRPSAVLCRTNGSVMAQAMRFMEDGLRVAIAGGTDSLVKLACAARDLREGKPVTHHELAAFTSWADLVAYTEESTGGDLRPFVQLINTHGVPTILRACTAIVDEATGNPQVTVSTMHKAKGREWPSVLIGDDSPEPKPRKILATGTLVQGTILKTDAMRNYVGVTRPRHHLDVGGLDWIDEYPAPAGA